MYEEYYILSSENTEVNQPEIIGQKASGLFNLICEYTPSFVVIKSKLFEEWRIDQEVAINTLSNMLTELSLFFATNSFKNYIVRSSALYESFKDRGNYLSSEGNISFTELKEVVAKIWEENLPIYNEYPNNQFAIIIQKYIEPKCIGHFSNERRVSRNFDIWLLEYSKSGEHHICKKKIKSKSISIRNTPCKNMRDVRFFLQNLSYTLVQREQRRYHIEWIWDGINVWVVQCDTENNNKDNTPPGHDWSHREPEFINCDFHVLNKISETANIKWNKTKCVQTFIELNLPFREIYILDSPQYLEELSKGIFNEKIKHDLEILLNYPIVIRTDIDIESNEDKILLPRTETLFSISDAQSFLVEKAKYFVNTHNVSSLNFCFLLHHFVCSTACALALSKPEMGEKTRIDSTWGIVDGLYYHPHDSFEITLNEKLDKIVKNKKGIRCKDEYLDIRNDGSWQSKQAGINYDWKESLTKQQLLKIANQTLQISKKLKKHTTVMFFIGLNNEKNNILPWFYTTDEIPTDSQNFSNHFFGNNYIFIENTSDLFSLKDLDNQDAKQKKFVIRLKLVPEILRDRDILEEIASYSKKHEIPIELNGSILAHPYYFLRKKGATVKCNIFNPQYKTQSFNKLVRDKIPTNIEQKGEITEVKKIDQKDLLSYLKDKVIEEALELYWEEDHNSIIEEIADVYEVIKSISKLLNVSMEDIHNEAEKKSQHKGSFNDGVVLVKTKEAPLIDVINVNTQNLFSEEKIQINNRVTTKHYNNPKVHINENTLHIPYIQAKNKVLNIPFFRTHYDCIEVSYKRKEIEVRFIKKRKEEDFNQLKLEFE